MAGSYFQYDRPEVEKAKQEGFAPYTEFPVVEQVYNGNVLDIFAQRLIKSERPDIQNFYSFWEIEPQFKDDKFYLLGHTQGLRYLQSTFEFLADYNPVAGLHFLTEIAGLSAYQLPIETLLRRRRFLRFEIDKDEINMIKKPGVKIFKAGEKEVGYVKKIHCRVFP